MWENTIELRSILCQGWHRDDFELIIIDESTTAENAELYNSVANDINIQYIHVSDWYKARSENLFVHKNDRVNHSIHYNWGIKNANANIICILNGEVVHIANTLDSFYATPDRSIKHATMRNIDRCSIQHYVRDVNTYPIDENKVSFTSWFSHPEKPGFHEFNTGSIHKKQLERLRGMDERYMAGWQCETNELLDRLERCDIQLEYDEDLLLGHIEHDKPDSNWATIPSDQYRAAQRVRHMMDAGYYDDDIRRIRYYRPGTEKPPLIANPDGWGIFPEEITTRTMKEVIQ